MDKVFFLTYIIRSLDSRKIATKRIVNFWLHVLASHWTKVDRLRLERSQISPVRDSSLCAIIPISTRSARIPAIATPRRLQFLRDRKSVDCDSCDCRSFACNSCDCKLALVTQFLAITYDLFPSDSYRFPSCVFQLAVNATQCRAEKKKFRE